MALKLMVPKDFDKFKNLSDFRSKSVRLINQAISGGTVSFKVAEKFKLKGPKKDSLPTNYFMLVKNEKDKGWSTIDDAAERNGTGQCRIVTGAHGKTLILIKSSNGSISLQNIINIANTWFSGLLSVEAKSVDSHAGEIAQKSTDDSTDDSTEDRVILPEVKKTMAKAILEFGEYKKFEQSFQKFLKKWEIEAETRATVTSKDGTGTVIRIKELPSVIWRSLILGIIKGSKKLEGSLTEKGAKDASGKYLALLVDDPENPEGKKIRDKAVQTAMDGLKNFTAHADKYLSNVVTTTRQYSKFCFWSGTGADVLAKKLAGKGGVVLENTVGSWFDEVWTFEDLTGFTNFQIWTALSELYAKKAAEHYKKFVFEGFVGPGASRENNVFSSIEQPKFTELLEKKYQITEPRITWNVVNCKKDAGSGNWVLDESESNGVAYKTRSRDDAIGKIKTLYGG